MGIKGTVRRFYFYYGWYYGPDGVGRPPRWAVRRCRTPAPRPWADPKAHGLFYGPCQAVGTSSRPFVFLKGRHDRADI